MKIYIADTEISATDLFKVIVRGWFTAISLLCLFMAVFMPIVLAHGSDVVWKNVVIGLLATPVIAAMQAVIVAAIIMLRLIMFPPPAKVNGE